ncbi:MAG: hypothetical protein MK077_02885 [Phycisphaerales bacterium]|nr:hypothetical protein [Phycisphaerales bacterium]
MKRDRLIQFGALAVVAAGVTVAGGMLPGLVETADRKSLRYTNVAVDNAPPIVALGTAIGALRGLVVDYLWIKANLMQEEGQYYDILEDARLITKLQPHFGQVWLFHGHNMAYNISVLTNTPQERWEWVNKGISLVRDEGLRYNPNDILLYKDLAWWLGHKVDGVSDDAHLYYKREFAHEWNNLLGVPPMGRAQREAWIKVVADAPDTLTAAIDRTPAVAELVERLNEGMSEYTPDKEFELDDKLLAQVAWWNAIQSQSWIAQKLQAEGLLEEMDDPMLAVLDGLLSEEELEEAWETLLAYLRKQILRDQYNMDAGVMYEYTRDLGPLDWRHPQSHSLYWSRLGSQTSAHRVTDDNEHHALNTDRQQLHSLQALARSGRVTYDQFSPGIPGRFPEPDFIDTVDELFEEFYIKYFDAKGAGGETFMSFMENFMSSAVRESYREGEHERARKILDRLDRLFGTGAYPPNHKYNEDLDVFIKNSMQGEYDRQPHLAVSDAVASLRYGFRVGIGQRRPEVYQEAIAFANSVIEFFKTNEYADYVTKMGTGRMADIIGAIGDSAETAFVQIMIDPSVPLPERITIWSQADELEPQIRLRTYDRIRPLLQRELSYMALGDQITIDEVLPAPPGIEAWRARMATEAQQRIEAADDRQGTNIERQ